MTRQEVKNLLSSISIKMLNKFPRLLGIEMTMSVKVVGANTFMTKIYTNTDVLLDTYISRRN